MAFVEPSKGRAKITDLGNKVRIEIPVRSEGFAGWFIFLFLTGWLIMWAAGEVSVGFEMLRQFGLLPRPENWGQTNGVCLFMIGWLIGWTAGGALVWYLWLLMVLGHEVITVSAMSLDIVTRPIGRLHRYQLTEISNLRVLESREGIMGTIAFDYGARTVRFGLTLDPAEARQIVALLKERFGQYMADGKIEAGS